MLKKDVYKEIELWINEYEENEGLNPNPADMIDNAYKIFADVRLTLRIDEVKLAKVLFDAQNTRPLEFNQLRPYYYNKWIREARIIIDSDIYKEGE